jgi:hypothetical protein
VEHHPDAGISALVSESPLLLAMAAFVFVVCAPVVEELLFRGLLAESLRARGAVVALAASSALFALWHLRPPFWYFFAMGALLWVLYWKRGLVASMAAHAAFNGTLVLAAVAVVLGPSHTLVGPGVRATVPATWSPVDPRVQTGADLAARGPSEALLVVYHEDGRRVAATPDGIAEDLRSGQLTLAGMTTRPATVRVAPLPAGVAVLATTERLGHEAEVAVVSRPGRLWLAVLVTAGSARARHDFDAILQHLSLA